MMYRDFEENNDDYKLNAIIRSETAQAYDGYKASSDKEGVTFSFCCNEIEGSTHITAEEAAKCDFGVVDDLLWNVFEIDPNSPEFEWIANMNFWSKAEELGKRIKLNEKFPTSTAVHGFLRSNGITGSKAARMMYLTGSNQVRKYTGGRSPRQLDAARWFCLHAHLMLSAEQINQIEETMIDNAMKSFED